VIADPSTASGTISANPLDGIVADGLDLVTVRVSVEDADGNPLAGYPITLAATGAENRIAQPPATDAHGFAQGTVASLRAETKTIEAFLEKDEGSTSLGTVDVTFVAGTPRKLGFLVEPTLTKPLIPFATDLQVAVQDANGNTVPGATDLVRLSTDRGTLLGPFVAEAAAGVATFDDVAIAATGVDLAIRAEADNLDGTVSERFSATPFDWAATYTPASAVSAPVAIEVFDYDGDTDPDLVVLNEDGAIAIFLNDGSGAFTESPDSFQTSRVPSVDFAWGYFDDDAFPDVAVLDSGCNVVVFFGNSLGDYLDTWTENTGGGGCTSIAIGDLGGSSATDLAVAADGSGYPVVFLNVGSRDFGDAVSVETGDCGAVSVEVEDLDDDARDDLIVGDGCGPFSVHHGFLVDGNFEDDVEYGSAAEWSEYLLVGDLDANPGVDLALWQPDAGGTDPDFYVFSGDGDGGFDEMVFRPGFTWVRQPIRPSFGDLNGDGAVDYLFGNRSDTFVTGLIMGDGAGNLWEVTDWVGTGLLNRIPRATAIADLDGDGLDDAIAAHTGPGLAETKVTVALQAP